MRVEHVMQGFCAVLGGLAVMGGALGEHWPWWACVAAFVAGGALNFGLGWLLDRLFGPRHLGRTR